MYLKFKNYFKSLFVKKEKTWGGGEEVTLQL